MSTSSTSAEPDQPTERDGSKLETDDEGYCMECGVGLPWDAAIIHGYELCPECKLQQVRDELLAVYGSLETSDIMRGYELPPEAEVDR